MLINVIVIFNCLGQSNGLVTPGSGVYVASIGMLAGILANVQLHRPQRAGSVTPVADQQR